MMKQNRLSHFARAAMLLAVLAMLTAGRGYLYYDAASALRQYTTGSPWPAAGTAATASTYVRPVAEVSISKE